MHPLTPGKSRFKPLGLLKTGRHSAVTLVLELSSKQKLVGRWFDRPPGATEVALLEGIDREAKILKTLSCPGITKFDKVVEGDGGTWMLFEWVEGIHLSHYLAVENCVPETWIIWWLYQIVETLNTLHTQTPPIVIGYLEPTDLIVVGDRLLIGDIGILEDMFPEVGASLLNNHPFMNFIAPEKRLAVQTTPAGDLFSAAGIAFWLATAHAPVSSGPKAQALLLAALQRLRPGLPLEVSQLIAQMLDYYPSQRPATAQEVLDRLGPFVTDLRGQAPPAPPQQETYKFVAEATRPMVSSDKPPRPIFDDSVSQEEGAEPPEPPPTAAEMQEQEDEAVSSVLASPALPVWREALDDLLWQLRRHPVVTLAIVAVAGSVLFFGGRAVIAPAAQSGHVAPLMSVVSGHVACKVDPKIAKYDGEWLPVTQLPVGALLTVGSAGASLQFDHSKVWLQGNSLLTEEERDHGSVTVRITKGQIRAQTAPGDKFLIRVSGGTLLVGTGSDVTAAIENGACKVTCQSGSATLSSGGGSGSTLSAGATARL